MHEGYLKGTRELKEKGVEIQISDKGELLYPDGSYALMSGAAATAIPFLDPKNGLELNWGIMWLTRWVPIHWILSPFTCAPAHLMERSTLIIRPTCGGGIITIDKNVGPMGEIEGKEDYIEGGSIFFKEPYDIRGLAGVRQRYPEAGKPDDFKVFIPSLRRTRTLTGSDAQDPIASGLELTWDDWRAYWSKTDVDNFEYKMVGQGFILASPEVGYVYDSMVWTENACNVKSLELELRPVWIFDIIDKTGKYMYSKRRTWVDKEFYYMQYHMTWDPRGNPLRNWDDVRAWRPSVGDAQWKSVIVNNYVTKRFSSLNMDSQWEDREDRVSEEMFDVDQLRDYQ